jgi:type IV secretory pathway VirB10-like protein
MFPRVVALVCGLAAAASLAACAKARAAEAAVMPTLAPPDVPPRVVADYEPDPPLPAEPVTPEAVTPPPLPPRPVRREAPRAEPADEPQGPPALAPPVVAPPPLALQTPGASARADQSVRTLLAQAARDLGRVDYQALDADRRAQYDTARRFMQQADDALKARNVMFAGKLADKAATMAAVLVR